MCGISVVLARDDGVDVCEAMLRMHGAIPHRGPDGEGFLLVGSRGEARAFRRADTLPGLDAGPARAGIAFRWLKIQDPDEAASQPMAAPDASAWLAFNGEIYNHEELRREARDRGHRFATRSDTEVVLAAYGEWGTDCFRRFNGMWAIVIADLARRRLVLCRDRFGIKPLFHARVGSRLLVASEAKQILAASEAPPAANPTAVAGHLRGLRSHQGDETFFEGVRSVPPAAWAELPLEPGGEDLRFHAYWDSADSVCEDPRQAIAFPEACAQLEGLLTASVDLQRRAWAPVGCLLSGGLDSSLLARTMAELQGEAGPPRAFSLVLDPRWAELDESRFVDAVVGRGSLESVRTTLDPAWVRQSLGRIARTQEEPPAGIAVLGQYRVFQAAAEAGTRVVLDGQGADELFAGYPRHQDLLLLDRLRRGRLFDLGREDWSLRTEEPAFLRGFLRRALLPRARHRLGLRDTWPWIRRSVPSRSSPLPTRHGRDPSRLNRALHADLTGYNLKAVLGIADRNSMAHSVEARVPYLDHRIVELALSLPDHYKAGAGLRKRILREAARRHLPPVVVARRDRIGFGAPEGEWVRSELGEPVRAAVEIVGRRFAGVVEPRGLAAFCDAFYAGTHDDFRPLWRCYALHAWAEAYGVSGL